MRRLFFVVFLLASTLGVPAQDSDCETWRSRAFFEQATLADVERCYSQDLDLDVKIPFHLACAFSEDFEIAEFLYKAYRQNINSTSRYGYSRLDFFNVFDFSKNERKITFDVIRTNSSGRIFLRDSDSIHFALLLRNKVNIANR